MMQKILHGRVVGTNLQSCSMKILRDSSFPTDQEVTKGILLRLLFIGLSKFWI